MTIWDGLSCYALITYANGERASDRQNKRVNPSYRSYTQGNPMYFETWYPVLSRVLLVRCVKRPSNFLPTTRDEMAGNAKSFSCFYFQTIGDSEMFPALSRVFVRLGFHLHCARLAVHFPLFGFREFYIETCVRQYGQHFSLTCLPTLLRCKLKLNCCAYSLAAKYSVASLWNSANIICHL